MRFDNAARSWNQSDWFYEESSQPDYYRNRRTRAERRSSKPVDPQTSPQEDEELEQFEWDTQGEEPVSISCAQCGMELYEDAFQCPRCGAYVEVDTHPLSGRPLWWILLGLLGLIATIVALTGFMIP